MPKEEPENDLCRCCHAEGVFKNLYESYSWMDIEEVVYSKLLQECFEVEMAPVTQPLQHMLCTICETCIERLQDAVKFKRQVLKCEKRFRDVYGSCVGEEPKFEVKVKQEIEVDLKDDSCNGESSKTSAVAASFRMLDDDDDDDDGFGDRDDDHLNTADGVKVKQEENSDSEDDICLKDVSKAKKRKGKGASPAAAKKKSKPAPVSEKTGDDEELEVIQGTSVIRVKTARSQKNIDYKPIGDQFQCLRCSVVCETKRSIRIHIKRVHLNTANYKCPFCSELFWEMMKVRKHQLEKHNIDNRHKCNACGKSFFSQYDLNKHKDIYHMLGEKMKCAKCGFESYNKQSFANHAINHSDEKKYQCQYCQKTFKRKTTMQFHERIHTGDRRKVCAECGQAFVQRASLKYHMNKHHPGVDF